MKEILTALFLFLASLLFIAVFAIMLGPMIAAEEKAVSIFAAAIIFSPFIFFLALILAIIAVVSKSETLKIVSAKLPLYYFGLTGIVTGVAVIISLF